MNKFKLLLAGILLLALDSHAQNTDSLLNSLTGIQPNAKVESTFKSTHIVLSQSSETEKKHDLDLRIRHHFGDIGGKFGSAHTLYGLDVASDLFIGLDYGVTDRFTVGIGRSKQDETYNLSAKYKLLEQKEGGEMPINLTLFAQTAVVGRETFSASEFPKYGDRFSWFFQGIISRKISSRLSLQVMPAYSRRTAVSDSRDNQNLVSIGFAGRMKITKRLSFIADYTLVNGLSRPTDLSQAYYNPLGLGLEIETGGHVFSLNFMNSEYILENNFIPNTKKSWTKGGARFGFTISRNFSLFKSKNQDPDKRSAIH